MKSLPFLYKWWREREREKQSNEIKKIFNPVWFLKFPTSLLAGELEFERILMSYTISLQTQLCFSEFKTVQNRLQMKKANIIPGENNSYTVSEWYRKSSSKTLYQIGIFEKLWRLGEKHYMTFHTRFKETCIRLKKVDAWCFYSKTQTPCFINIV